MITVGLAKRRYRVGEYSTENLHVRKDKKEKSTKGLDNSGDISSVSGNIATRSIPFAAALPLAATTHAGSPLCRAPAMPRMPQTPLLDAAAAEAVAALAAAFGAPCAASANAARGAAGPAASAVAAAAIAAAAHAAAAVAVGPAHRSILKMRCLFKS